ncbi:hypothetical protein I4U23_022377 [Adineta vaga]|nr:hypothetical protein I4U23_022377 [Adineta vaga]
MLLRISSTLSFFLTLCVLSIFVDRSIGLNVLFICDGGAGHLTPLFQLARTMKHHNITFLTQRMALVYIDLDSFSSPLFRPVYADNSTDALLREKHDYERGIHVMSNHSLLTAMPELVPSMIGIIQTFLYKIIEILTHEHFDVIIAGQMIFGTPLFCKTISTPCVVQKAAQLPDLFDFNSPNMFTLLTQNEITQLPYRIYNAIFTGYATLRLLPVLIPTFYKFFQSLPQVPGLFYNSFTLKSFLTSDMKCLELISIPQSFLTLSYPNHYQKYLGPFIDDTKIRSDNSALSIWVKSKPISSIIFGAFGSSSLIPYDRMSNLINGLAKFLIQTDDSFLLLALRDFNYETYKTVLKDISNNRYRQIFEDNDRVRIEQGYVKQKWILQQTSVKVFLTHCGMGSALEGLYFVKVIVCMPFNVDQFANAVSIENLKLGQSLFTRPSLLQTLFRLGDFTDYTFTDESVTRKLSTVWTNTNYETEVERMSLEMKHAGGLQRAVQEIEFFVKLNGNLDRYAPLPSTLPFYQRYLLDLLFIFIVLPLIVTRYILSICCKRRKKTKTD